MALMDLQLAQPQLATIGPHLENLMAVLALSQQNGGRSVAMLVKGPLRYAAVDQSHLWAGHTALVVLLHQIPGIPDKAVVYVAGDLSEADIGVFLPLVKWHPQRRIYRIKGSNVYVHNPAMQERWRVEGPVVVPLDAELPMAVQLTLPIFKGVSLFAFLRPAVLLPSREMCFTDLNKPAQRLFDFIFLSLCASFLARAKDQGKKLPGIGAVIVNQFGEIMSYGNDLSPELHAETVTIKKLQGSLGYMPDMTGCRYYTSLEPCMMCSGFIYESCVRNPRAPHPKDFKVIYLQWDPAVHQAEAGPQKFTGIPTVLNETGVYDVKNQPMMMYELEIQRLKLDKLHQAKPEVLKVAKVKTDNAQYLKQFEKSAVKTVEFPSFRRRFAKMKLRLLAMPLVIEQVCGPTSQSAAFLMKIWWNVLRFLEVDCGHGCMEEMQLVAEYLNATAGKNPLRMDEDGYALRKRKDFLKFYAEYVRTLKIFPI